MDKKGGVGSGGGCVGDKQFRMPAAAFKPNLITSSPTWQLDVFISFLFLQRGQCVTTIAFGNNPLIHMRRAVAKGMTQCDRFCKLSLSSGLAGLITNLVLE